MARSKFRIRPVHAKLPRFPYDDPSMALGPDDWPPERNAYELRWKVAHNYKPTTFIEFGAHYGFGFVTVLDACPSIKWAGWVDDESLIPNSNQACRENLDAYLTLKKRDVELERWSYRWKIPKMRVDLVVVDGDHSYDGCAADLLVTNRLEPQLILVDDYLNCGGVKTATDEYASLHGYTVTVCGDEPGLAIIDTGRR